MTDRHMKDFQCHQLLEKCKSIKTAMRYHVTPVRVAIIKKSTKKFWRGCGKNGTLLPGWWECKLIIATIENSMELGFSHSSVNKESACSVGELGLITGSRRSSGEGNGNPLQYSCLKNPVDRGAWWATVHRVVRAGHDLVTKPPPLP